MHCVMYTTQESIIILYDDMAIFLHCCIQMARLQNSMILKAASSLDFQKDMIGSINMLLCEKQPNISLRLLRQMDNKKSVFITGNSSGKCCSKLLIKQSCHTVLMSSSCIYILALQYCM